MTDTSPLRTSRAPSLIPVFNHLIKRLIRIGMPFGPNVLLTVRGRTSGLPRTFPVTIIELDGRRYIQSPFGMVNWVHNLRASGEAVVTKGRRQELVDAIEIAPDVGGPILRNALATYMRSRLLRPLVGRFFGFLADSTLGDYIAEARLHPMFELRAR